MKLRDIAARYGEEVEVTDLTEGSDEEAPDPRDLRESAKIAKDVEVPAEVEERLRRDRDEDEDDGA